MNDEPVPEPDKKERRPIGVIRDSAGSMEIGESGEAITGMITFDDRLLAVKERSVYEIKLADQIDPERTNPDIPNTSSCLMSYGSEADFVARSLLQGDALFKDNYLRDGFTRDQLMPLALDFAVDLSAMKSIIDGYVEQERELEERLNENTERGQRSRSLEVPTIPGVEERCKSFFVQAKRSMQHLLDMAAVFYGDHMKKGFFTQLEQMALKEYGEGEPIYQFFKAAVPFVNFIRMARNAVEHPNKKKNEYAIIKNVRLDASGKVIRPSFELVHPECAQPEIDVGRMMESIFEQIVEVGEHFMAVIVDKNLVKEIGGLAVQVAELPDEEKSARKHRYGICAMMGDRLVVMG